MYYPRRNAYLMMQPHALRAVDFYMMPHPSECVKSKSSYGKRASASPRQSLFGLQNFHIVDGKDAYQMYLELPGVKAENLKVQVDRNGDLSIQGQRSTNRSNQSSQSIEQKFRMNDQMINAQEITATFSDGLLELVAPKKGPSAPRRVAVVASAPTVTEASKTYKSFEVDLPGVKLDDLSVKLDNNKLSIKGERTRGEKKTPVLRGFRIDPRVVEAERVEAFLADGVLTLRFPPRETFTRDVFVNGVASSCTDTKEDKTVEPESAQDTEEEQGSDEEEDEFHDIPSSLEMSDSDEPDEIDAEQVSKENESSKDRFDLELEFEVVPETVTEADDM